MLHPVIEQIFKDFNKVFPVTEERYVDTKRMSESQDESQGCSQILEQEQDQDCES